MTEFEAKSEILRLRMEADALESQIFANRICSMGFEPWGSSKHPNEGDTLITVRRDKSFGFIPSVEMKNWSWYNLDYWAKPQDLSPRVINEVKSKMLYPSLGYFRKWLGESFEGDWNYTL